MGHDIPARSVRHRLPDVRGFSAEPQYYAEPELGNDKHYRGLLLICHPEQSRAESRRSEGTP